MPENSDRQSNKLETLRDDIMREVGKDSVPSAILCAVRDILIGFMSKNEVIRVHESRSCGRRWAVDWDFPEEVKDVEIIVGRETGIEGGTFTEDDIRNGTVAIMKSAKAANILHPIRFGDLVNNLVEQNPGPLSLALVTLIQHMGDSIILVPESWDIVGGELKE